MTEVQDLIQSIQAAQAKPLSANTAPDGSVDVNFGDTVRAFLQAVNKNSKTASSQVSDIVEGRSENLAGAMIAMEESKLSFQLMLEIRNKLLESYQEIQRMQI